MKQAITLLTLAFVGVLAADATAQNRWSSATETHTTITITSYLITIRIEKDPFQVTYLDQDGSILLQQRPADDPGTTGPRGPFTYAVEPVSRALGQPVNIDPYLPRSRLWFHATKLESFSNTGPDTYEMELETSEIEGGEAVTMNVEFQFQEPPRHSVANPASPHADYPDRALAYPDVVRVRAQVNDVSGLEQTGDTFYLDGNERFYGFGQLWDTVESRGKRRAMQIELDITGPQGLNDNSAPVPFYVSNKGYGLFAEMPTWGEFGLGNIEPDKTSMQFSMWGGGDPNTPEGMLTYYIIAGPEPLQIIRRYNEMTAMPPLPPRWNFGPHHWRNKLSDGERMIRADMAGIRNNDLPHSVLWFDAPWETAYNTFEFNEWQFPDINMLIADMKAEGFRLICWSTPFMNFTDDSDEQEGMDTDTGGLFEFGRDNGYYLVDPLQQGFFIAPWWKGTGAWVDFTNPDAYDWFQDLIRWAVRRGVDGWKLDDGYCADNAVFHGGETGLHKQYEWRLLFHKIYHDVLEDELGHEGGGVLINRTGNYGDQKYCEAFWPGDLYNDYTYPFGLPSAITAGISLGVIGYPYYGSDIGGFKGGTPAKDVYLKWIQFGALSPVMQNGGGGNHQPWEQDVWDQETLEVYRKYCRLHNDLFPYIYTYAHHAHEFGHPIMRGLYLHHMGDPAAEQENWNYYFGDWLFVAPSYQPGFDVDIYFPEGRYLSFWDDEEFTGPSQVTYQMSFENMALFAKSGAIIPMLWDDVDTLADATVAGVIDYDDRDDRRKVKVWPDGESTFEVWDGTVYTSSESPTEPSYTFTVANAPKSRLYEVEVRYKSRTQGNGEAPVYLELTDGTPLSQVVTIDKNTTCVNCWSWDAAREVLTARIEGTDVGFSALHLNQPAAPQVSLAGFMTTDLASGIIWPQQLQLLALTEGTVTDLDIHYQGIPTGLSLHDDGMDGDAVAGDGAWMFQWWFQFPSKSPAPTELLLELAPKQGGQTFPVAWPYLTVEN